MALLDPTAQARYRSSKSKWLNFSQRYCKGCNHKRSTGQFTHGVEICDQCYLRTPKTA